MKLREKLCRPDVNHILDDVIVGVLDEVRFQVRYQVEDQIINFVDIVWEQVREDLDD